MLPIGVSAANARIVASGQGFPRSRRICDAKVFAQVFAKRLRFSRGVLQVYVRPNDSASSRLGMAISRSAAGTAVSRNWLKRQTRETFRQLVSELGSVDLVVNITKPMPAAALKTYANDLRSLLERAAQCVRR